MFNKNKIALSITAGIVGAIGIMTSAQAVHVNPDGTGQVLLYPYYNARVGYVTNVNLVNSTDETKAVRIRFRESKTSRDMLDFNIYLSPHDVWTGTVEPTLVFPRDPKTGKPDNTKSQVTVGAVRTKDRSCTLPVAMAATCVDDECLTVEDGMRDFHGYYLFPDLEAADTQEGYIEVIEMGVVTDVGAQSSVLHNEYGKPNNCKALETTYWNNKGGIFTNNGGIKPPTGGLFGHTAVINVEQGTAFAIDPVALDHYSTDIWSTAPDMRRDPTTKLPVPDKLVPQHTRPDIYEHQGVPSLASGNVRESSVLRGGTQSAMYVTQWKPFEKDVCLAKNDPMLSACGTNPYPIAHVLSAPYVMNEYFVDPSNGYDGHTDWVITFPMKKYGLAWQDKTNFETPEADSPAAYTVADMANNKGDTSKILAFIETLVDREEGYSRRDNPGDFGFSPVPPPSDPIPDPNNCMTEGKCTWLTREVNVVSFKTKFVGTKGETYNDSYTVLSSDKSGSTNYEPMSFNVGKFASGWSRWSFKGYNLKPGFESAVGYGSSATNPTADDSIYNGVPMLGGAFIQGKVVSAKPDDFFSDMLPHKYKH